MITHNNIQNIKKLSLDVYFILLSTFKKKNHLYKICISSFVLKQRIQRGNGHVIGGVVIRECKVKIEDLTKQISIKRNRPQFLFLLDRVKNNTFDLCSILVMPFIQNLELIHQQYSGQALHPKP